MNAGSVVRILIFVSLVVLFAVVVVRYARPEFPITRKITSTDGKSLEALIEGKIADTIYMRRLPDRKRFTLTLDQLSYKDRALLTIMKEEPPADMSYEDDYIRNRMAQIKELRKKINVMMVEFNSATLSSPLQSSYRRRIIKHEKEIRELEVAIETHRYRLKKR